MEGWQDILKLLGTIVITLGLIILLQHWPVSKSGLGMD